MNRPSFIGHYLDFLDDDDAHYPGSDELLSIGSAVGKKLGLKKIGIHIETLLPGRRTSWPHAESEEEEFGFVIEGNPDVWIDGTLHALKPGDFVAFPSGTGIAHT
nr:cupin domain-containing protein [Bdellovibrionales bacterium]